MFMHAPSTLGAVALLAGLAAAKTDIGGCVSSQTVAYGGASLIWYVPDTGEICEFLDCGGGRAPPKTTVPGCPAYEGTATYSPSYLPGFGAVATSTSAEAAATATATKSSVSEHSSASEHSSSSEHSSLSESASTSASERSAITSPPVTIITATATSSGSVQTQTGVNSDVASSSSSSHSSSLAPAASGNSTGSSTSSVSVGGAALPTAAMKGAFGVMAGLAAGVALL
ncbi:hypothetical protein F5X98DRAFT_16605 [Xylaria grammica]|nr:hypothetical protein F5X98DRAFT_16605 [Xylaria grammica]